MDFSKRLSDCLDLAGISLSDISTKGLNDDEGRIHWLQMQLSNVISELSALLADLESGFSFDSDVNELVEGFELEITSLRAQIKSLLMARVVGK